MDISKVYDVLEGKVGIVNSRNAINLICSSIGGHFLNLYNLKVQNVMEKAPIQKQGSVISLRNHLLFIRPSGFGKSLLLRTAEYMLPEEMRRENQLMTDITDTDTGDTEGNALKINYNDNAGKIVRYTTTITEAGAVGTYQEGKVKPGYFYECRQGFVLVEEFSAILSMFKATHSSTFQQILLTALDSGKVNKRLAAGSLDYETQMTLMAGIQPAVVDIEAGAGLWRRFAIELFIPTMKIIENTKRASIESWDTEKSQKAFDALSEISEYIYETLYSGVYHFKGITITDEFKEFLMKLKISAALIDHYVKLAAGYHYFFGNIEEEHVVVDIDKHLRAMIVSDYVSRKLMLFNMASLIVIMSLKQMLQDGYNENHITLLDLFDYVWHYQMSEGELRSVVKLLLDVGLLRKTSSVTDQSQYYQIVDSRYLNKLCNYTELLQEICAKGELTYDSNYEHL